MEIDRPPEEYRNIQISCLERPSSLKGKQTPFGIRSPLDGEHYYLLENKSTTENEKHSHQSGFAFLISADRSLNILECCTVAP